MPQRPSERALVTGQQPVEQQRPMLPFAAAQEQRAHHRRRGQRDQQRHQDRQRQRQRELAEQPPDDAPHQQDRDEHRDQRQADREHGEPHLAGAAQRRLDARHALLQVALDVLQHDDRVVDHEACGDRERHQRQVVQAEAQQVHRAERADDGDGHGDEGDQRRAQIAQEQEHHHRHKAHRDHQRALGVEQRCADCRGAVGGQRQVDIARHCRHQMRQLRLHSVDGIDDVGAGLAEQDDQHGRLAVGEPGVAQILDRILHVGDIGKAHRGAVAIRHHQRHIVRGGARLVVRVDLVAPSALLDCALRAVGVGRGERRPHVLQPDAVFEQRARIEFDAHRRQRRSADDHLADAAELRQALLQHVARGVVELAAGQRLGGQRQDQDRRVRRIHFPVCRVGLEAGRQVGVRRVDRGLHVAGGAVDVAVEAELQRDARLPDGALRGHLGDVGDFAEMPLQRARDRRRHGVGARARKLRGDRDGRKIHLRQRRDRQSEERQRPGERDPHRQQGRRDRTRDEWRRKVHGDITTPTPRPPAAPPAGRKGAAPIDRMPDRSPAS